MDAASLDEDQRNRPTLLLVVNPRATRVGQRLTERVRAALDVRFDVEVIETGGPGHAAALCRASGPGFAAVAAFGGDGTLNEAANGLAGGAVPLVCLPGGLTNVFCRSLGLGRDPVAAAELVAAPGATTRAIDLGRVAGRAFLFASGLGLSAALTQNQTRGPRRPAALVEAWAIGSAVWAVGRELRRRPRLRVTSGDRVLEGSTLVVQNTDRLTYLRGRPLRVAEGGGLSTRSLSMAVLRGAGPRDVLELVPRVLAGDPSAVVAHPQVDGLAGFEAAHVEVLDGRCVSLEVDGEYLGEWDSADYSVLPDGLSVVVGPPRR
jgi:diacylglycerol kinase family enzyme